MKKLTENKYFLCMLALTCAQGLVAQHRDTIDLQGDMVIATDAQGSPTKFVTTPLHTLIVTHFDDKNEKLQKINALLDSGADVNAQDEDHRTPLWLVTFKGGDLDIFNSLIAHGADITIPDMFNVTPLHNVSARDDKVAASILVDTAIMLKPHSIEKMVAFKDDAEQTPLTIAKTPEMDEILLAA